MILWKRCILKENKKMDKVLLHIEHLTKRYDKDTVALRDVSIDFKEGGFRGGNRAFGGRKIHPDTLY